MPQAAEPTPCSRPKASTVGPLRSEPCSSVLRIPAALGQRLSSSVTCELKVAVLLVSPHFGRKKTARFSFVPRNQHSRMLHFF